MEKYLAVDTIGNNAYLGIKTVVQGMVIVFSVLILLSLLVMLVSAIIRSAGNKNKAEQGISAAGVAVDTGAVPAAAAAAPAVQTGTKGNGELVVEGVDSEEEVAVIMAAVAAHNGSALDSLDFISIKRV